MAMHQEQQTSDPIFLYKGPLSSRMFAAMEHAFDGDFTTEFVEFEAMEGGRKIRVRVQGLHSKMPLVT